MDRLKIFSIFLFIAAVLLTPLILFCVRTDDTVSWSYTAILTPLWVAMLVILVMHVKMIFMPVVTPPEDDDGSWVDPFPRSERIVGALSHFSFFMWEVRKRAEERSDEDVERERRDIKNIRVSWIVARN